MPPVFFSGMHDRELERHLLGGQLSCMFQQSRIGLLWSEVKTHVFFCRCLVLTRWASERRIYNKLHHMLHIVTCIQHVLQTVKMLDIQF